MFIEDRSSRVRKEHSIPKSNRKASGDEFFPSVSSENFDSRRFGDEFFFVSILGLTAPAGAPLARACSRVGAMAPKKKITKKKPKKKTATKKRASARKSTGVDAATRAVQKASPLAGLKKPENAYASHVAQLIGSCVSRIPDTSISDRHRRITLELRHDFRILHRNYKAEFQYLRSSDGLIQI